MENDRTMLEIKGQNIIVEIYAKEADAIKGLQMGKKYKCFTDMMIIP